MGRDDVSDRRIERQTDGQSVRQTDRDTKRERDRETGRQRQREADRDVICDFYRPRPTCQPGSDLKSIFTLGRTTHINYF